ncbi:MAG TPA: hypothetical protein VD969_10965 [Symbiobacteriaceae bacterium]|nr:hypothetical protein [Symbiobacteriaceae bacterium]
MNKALVSMAAALVGVLPGFFLVFHSVFADSSSTSERLVALLLIAAAYGLLGAVFGFFAGSWRVGVWLAFPALVMVALYSLKEYQHLLLHVATGAVTLAAACGGARAGAHLRR